MDALFYLCIEFLFFKLINRNQGFIDKKGNEVINLQYDYANSFDENGIAKVYICDDTDYKKLSFMEQIEYVLKNGRVGYIDTTGKYIWEPTK